MFNDDNQEHLVLRLRIADNACSKLHQEAMGDEDEPEELADRLEDDTFLRLIEQNLLSDISLQGLPNSSRTIEHPLGIFPFPTIERYLD